MEMRGMSVIGLPSYDQETGLLNAIIETPKGARNKFSYDERLGLFRLKKVLPAGAVFPFHFGFIPGTWGEDEGPLDVLVLMEEPAFPGCLVPSRLLGVLEAEQTKHGKCLRNDRFIAVADKMPVRNMSFPAAPPSTTSASRCCFTLPSSAANLPANSPSNGPPFPRTRN